MRRTSLVLAMTLALATCTPPDRGSVSAPGVPQFGHVQDLDGTPDMIVDARTLATSWVVYDHTIKEGACSLQEANLVPGQYRLLRFTVNTPNIGTADIFIGDPNRHWDPNGDGEGSDSDGLFENNACHRHYHFRNYALYQLIDASGKITRARKNGFCMIDVAPYNDGAPPKSWVYRACGRPARPDLGLPEVPGNQGISVGYADQYYKWLDGQYFVLNDPNAALMPPGDYTLRIWVNPPFTRTSGEPCPAVDSDGLCHMFRESNYNNNIGQVAITIPAHAGKTGVGPGAESNPPADEIIDDENRPGTK
jgi:lysyl oxidase